MKDLIEMLPYYYKTSSFMKTLMVSAGAGIAMVEEYMRKTRDNLSIMSCDTEGLMRYEKIYCIIAAYGTENEQRRARVLAKMRSTGFLSLEQLDLIFLSFGIEKYNIVQNVPRFEITIEYLSVLGEPPCIDDLVYIIRELLPAHIQIEHKFLYNTWKDTSDESFDEVGTVSWNRLSVMEGIK